MDESADGTILAVLLALVWYQPPRTIGEVLVSKCGAVAQTVPEQSVSSTSFESHGLFWNRCVDMCTDGAEGPVGKNAGGRSQIQAMAPSSARKRGFFTATGSLKKSTCVMVPQELNYLFSWKTIFTGSSTNCGCLDLAILVHLFLENEQNKLVTSKKTIVSICYQQ